jgi:hypothetical protein
MTKDSTTLNTKLSDVGVSGSCGAPLHRRFPDRVCPTLHGVSTGAALPLSGHPDPPTCLPATALGVPASVTVFTGKPTCNRFNWVDRIEQSHISLRQLPLPRHGYISDLLRCSFLWGAVFSGIRGRLLRLFRSPLYVLTGVYGSLRYRSSAQR